MPRLRRQSRTRLRGSVTQNAPTMRLRSKEMTPRGFLIRLGTLVGGVVLVLALIALVWRSGWPQREGERIEAAGMSFTQKLNFAVKDIIVIGREQTSKDSLTSALSVGLGSPLLGFDPEAAQIRISALPWVKTVTVQRRLPDTIIVRLTERIPFARWQHAGQNVVIDDEGKELPDAKFDQFSQLPLVVGSEAPEHTHALLEVLVGFPAVTQKMTAATFVGERRWDIYLQSKIIAKMPEGDMTEALKSLSQLITEKKILERDIIGIDLRLPDRLIIEPAHATNRSPGDARL